VCDTVKNSNIYLIGCGEWGGRQIQKNLIGDIKKGRRNGSRSEKKIKGIDTPSSGSWDKNKKKRVGHVDLHVGSRTGGNRAVSKEREQHKPIAGREKIKKNFGRAYSREKGTLWPEAHKREEGKQTRSR